MIILIPMGGKGSRFKSKGYSIDKALLPTYNRHHGRLQPMALASLNDIPGIHDEKNKLICVGRDTMISSGLQESIQAEHRSAQFIYDHVQLDQAFGCYLARQHLLTDEQLFIGCCDCGFDIDQNKFEQLKNQYDAIILTHKNTPNIKLDSNAHSWIVEDENNGVKRLSIKQAVSNTPCKDHATTGLFWFKNASIFLKALENIIHQPNFADKKHVDHVINEYIKNSLSVAYIDVNFFCWGTPQEYENYQQTYEYWKQFTDQGAFAYASK